MAVFKKKLIIIITLCVIALIFVLTPVLVNLHRQPLVTDDGTSLPAEITVENQDGASSLCRIGSNASGGAGACVDFIFGNTSYRLQQETENYLDQINKPVTIYVLQDEDDFENSDSSNREYYVQANKLLHAMEAYCDELELQYIDLDSQPAFINAYPQIDWTSTHAALVVCGDQYRAVDLTDMFSFDKELYYYYNEIIINKQQVEQAFISAILNVTTSDKPKVVVLNSHGEQDLSAFTALLEDNAYEVETISLLMDSLPDDSDIVILYAPDVDISDSEYKTLSDWLKNDGKYGHHLMYIPNMNDPEPFKNINTLLSEYGMEISYGYIIDEKYAISDSNLLLSYFEYADDVTYTEDLFHDDIPVVMSFTMPVLITDKTIAQPLLLSSSESQIGYVNEDDPEISEEKGVLNGAAIGVHNDGSADGANSSVVVVGSPFALSSNYLSQSSFNNAPYFVNLCNVLTEHEDISVVIEGKDPTADSASGAWMDSAQVLAFIFRFIMPIIILLTGMII